jgi:uncharacterized RDD family membrane protein YckC
MMTKPVKRAGSWWQEQPDGSWLKWSDDRGQWEPQPFPPPPPIDGDEQLDVKAQGPGGRGSPRVGNVAGFAGFWRRFAAALIDSVLLGIGFFVLTLVFFFFHEMGATVVRWLVQPSWLAGAWLYYALMESSDKQGTFGKMALTLRVTDLHGSRVTFGRATGRYFGKFISGLPFGIGYMMAGWTSKKQALHDHIAGTLVWTVEERGEAGRAPSA